jgi:peptidoglycan hydrolase-like protein with peptidoglycan-binding domain
MRVLTITTIMALLAGLFAAGVALGQQQQQKEPQQQQQQSQKQDEAQLTISAHDLNSAQIRQLQESLQEKGVNPGPIDGKMGPLTQQSIELFQQQENLAATGDLNSQTLEALDIEVDEFMGLSPKFEEEQQGQQPKEQKQQQQ